MSINFIRSNKEWLYRYTKSINIQKEFESNEISKGNPKNKSEEQINAIKKSFTKDRKKKEIKQKKLLKSYITI